MILTILSDNRANNQQATLGIEHGLSIHIAHEGKNFLCDFGASDVFVQNANEMRIDLNQLNFAFLSHAHNDHSGGMEHFLKHYNASIYAATEVFNKSYFSSRRTGMMRDLSTDSTLFAKYDERISLIGQSQWVDDQQNIAIVKNTSYDYPMPHCNQHLYMQTGETISPDDFAHELSLVFRSERGLIIISSCSHCGMLNIIRSCQTFTGEKRVQAFVGGLHLVDSEECEREVEQFIATAHSEHPELHIYTGHCTGNTTQQMLEDSPLSLQFFHVGTKIEIE